MKTSSSAVHLIKEFEGFRSKAYTCPGGYKTIGFGHVLRSDDNLAYIDENEAEKLLEQDLKIAEISVIRNIAVDLTQGQFDALTSFSFNLGSAALQRSTLRQKVNRLEHEEVPREFLRWVYAGGIVMPGLVRRREAEVNLYLG